MPVDNRRLSAGYPPVIHPNIFWPTFLQHFVENSNIGQQLLTQILPVEIKDLNVKLPPHFYQFFDILTEFKKVYPQTDSVKSIKNIQDYLQLRDIPVAPEGPKQYPCMHEATNLVRIINKMVKDSVKLISPFNLDQSFKVINNNSTVESTNPSKRATYKKWSAYIKGKSPEDFI